MGQLSPRDTQFLEEQEANRRAMLDYERALIAYQQDAPNREAAKVENARRIAEYEAKAKAHADDIARVLTQKDVNFIVGDIYLPRVQDRPPDYHERVNAAWMAFQLEVSAQQPLHELQKREIRHVKDFCKRNYIRQDSPDSLRRVLGHLCRIGIVQRSHEDWSPVSRGVPRPQLLPIAEEPARPIPVYTKRQELGGDQCPYKPGTIEYDDWFKTVHLRESARETWQAFEQAIQTLTYYDGVALRDLEKAELFTKITELAEQNRVMPWTYASNPADCRKIAMEYMPWASHIDPLPTESPDAVKSRELIAKARNNPFLKQALLQNEARAPEVEPSEEYKARMAKEEEQKKHLAEQARLRRLTPGQRRAEMARMRQVEIDNSAAEVEARRKIVEESADAVYARERAEELKVERKVKQIVDEFTFPKLVERVKKQRATYEANRKAAGFDIHPFTTTPEQEASRMIDNLVRTGGRSTSDFA